MPDVNIELKGFNVEFNDNLTTSPNIESGDDIKTSFARIHKRFSDLENVSTDIEQIEYALKHLSEQIDNKVKDNITTGYYISGIEVGDDWTEHMDTDDSSQYTPEAIYLGARQINKNLKITVAGYKVTSGRCFGFCDENDTVIAYYKENYSIWEENQDGTYTATLPIAGPYFFLSYSNLEILGITITEELLNRTGYVSPNGSDENGGGTINFAFKTVNQALISGCDRIILAGGVYKQQIDLSLATGNHLEFISYDRNSRPVFYDPDYILTDSATLSSGIYSTTIDQTISSNNIWIYQEGVADADTQIAETERLPVQRGKEYRLEDTRIEKCSSDNLSDALDEISNSSVYKWYVDSGTLYFSAPSAPSSTHPICLSTGKELFSNANRSISIKMSGIQCKYIALNLKNLCNAEAIDCCATNIYGYGAITYDGTLNAYFLRCEASACRNDTSGDGFNADVTNTGEAFSKHYTATLIDCWSHDNTDDGYSDHRRAETTVIGGLFEYNGKSGLTPAYGAHCSCYNVYSRKNFTGFMCVGDVEVAEGGKFTQMLCNSCVAEYNNRGGYETGFYVDGQNNRMTLIGCKSIGNPSAYYVGQTASLKLIDCTAADNNRFIHGYPSNATVENTGLYRYIPTNEDLNNFYGAQSVGNYLCSNGNAPTILHKPTDITTTFRMDVMFYNDQTTQIIYPNDDQCLFYTRLYNGTTWSDWKESATAMQILSYGNSTWNDFINVYKKNAIVYCRASSNADPTNGSQTRMAFMAYVNDSANPTEVEFQYYRSVSSHTDSQQGDQVFVYKLNKTNGWSVTTRNAFSKVAVTSPIAKSYASGTITLSHEDSGVTAGTYNSVTVDAKGHVTAGSNVDIVESIYGLGTIIPQNADLDTYTNVGVFYASSATDAATYTNCPSVYPFRMEVEKTNGQERYIQTIYETVPGGSAAGRVTVYRRVYTLSGWGNWYTFKDFQPEINTIVNSGAKNLIKLGFEDRISDPTVTKTADGNGIIVNGNRTSSSTLVLIYDLVGGESSVLNTRGTLPAGRYKVVGTGNEKLFFQVVAHDGTNNIVLVEAATNTEFEYTAAQKSTYPYIGYRLATSGNASYDNLTFYPMIYRAEITDSTYQPYAPTNRTLYETKTEQTETNVIANRSSKNLLCITNRNGRTISGVTFTVNSNDSISISGATTSTSSLFRFVGKSSTNTAYTYQIPIQKGKYKIFCANATSSDTFALQFGYRQTSNGSRTSMTLSAANNFIGTFEITTDTGRYDLAVFSYDKTQNYSATVYPMICPIEITDNSFQSYSPTNRELYKNKYDSEMLFGIGDRKILTNDDLNSRELGTFYCVNASNLTGIPSDFSSGFYGYTKMDCHDGGWGDNYLIQVIYPLYKNYSAKRIYYPDEFEWGVWKLAEVELAYSEQNKAITTSIFSEANALSTGAVHYRYHSATSGTDKPVAGRAYDYQIMSPIIIAYERGIANSSAIYVSNKVGGTWGKWNRYQHDLITFGTCDSLADAQTKVVTISDTNWTKTIGGIIAVKFANTNTFSATADKKIKLSVNGEEAEIYYNNAASPTGTNTICYGVAGRYAYYIWDGTYWVWLSHGSDNNTTYSGMSAAEINAGTATTNKLISPANLNKAIRGLCNSLDTNADLNNYKTSGSYYSSSTAKAKSYLHRPNYTDSSNKLIRLDVYYISGTTSLMQVLYTLCTAGTAKGQIETFYRGFYSDTWGSWKQVSDSTIADYTGT